MHYIDPSDDRHDYYDRFVEYTIEQAQELVDREWAQVIEWESEADEPDIKSSLQCIFDNAFCDGELSKEQKEALQEHFHSYRGYIFGSYHNFLNPTQISAFNAACGTNYPER